MAQNQYNIDSLLNVLKTVKDDTNKVKILNDLSKQLRSKGDYDSAKKYSDDALLISEELNFKSGELLAYNGFRYVDRNQGKYSDALINFNATLKIAQELGDKNHVSGALVNMGLVYWNQGNYPEALKHYLGD